jgi:hypothetical protein
MDFDHLPGFTKDFTIGSPANWTSVARIRAEIAKTQVLCSNCHRIVTWERKNGEKIPQTPLTGRLRHAIIVIRGSGEGSWDG